MPGRNDYTEIIRRAAPYMGLGGVFAATIALLAWLGHWLDGRFGSRPWLTLCGALLGMAIGFYNFIATILRRPSDE